MAGWMPLFARQDLAGFFVATEHAAHRFITRYRAKSTRHAEAQGVMPDCAVAPQNPTAVLQAYCLPSTCSTRHASPNLM